MKKIIFILALFVSFVANAQYTPPTGYTNINSRYDWLAGVFRALGLPAGGNASFTTGQAQRAGSVYYDSTGVDAGLKVWNGTAWVGVGEVTQSALDDTAAAIRADFPVTPTWQQTLTAGSTLTGNNTVATGGFDFTFDNIDEFYIKRSSINRFAASSTQTYIASPDGQSFLQTVNTGVNVFAGPTLNNGRMSLGDNVASFGIGSSYTTGLTLTPTLATFRNTTGGLNIQAGTSDSLRLIHDNYSIDTTTYKLQARNPVTGALVDTDWPEAANLLFDSLGVSGISPVTTRNDTLYSRRISVTGGLTVDTTASGGLVIDASGVSGGGIANTNAGAFYRWLKPDAQEIKTFAAGYGVIIDSTTNTDALTARIDTNLISTRAWRDKLADSLGAIIDAIPAGGATGEMVKTMYLSAPTTADNITYYYSDSAITVTKVADVLTGTSPSVTYNVFFASTRNSGTPDSLFTSPRTATSVSGATTTTFNDNTIPAGSWIWLRTYATSGTVNDISVNLLYPGGGGGGGSAPSLTQYRIAVGDASNEISDNAAITGNRALISDANGVPTHSATTATELGYVNGVTSSIQTQLDKEIGIIQNATYTLTSSTATQKLFDAVANGEITVAANTTYMFECMFSLTSMSAVSGNCGFDVLGAGTATFTSVTWVSIARDATNLNVAVSPSTVFSSAAAQTGNISTAATTTGLYAVVRGTIRVNAGGTIIPSTNLADAAAAVVGVNSYFKLYPIGSGSITSW